MRQVPKEKLPYLIIGNGRIARHFRHYFQLQSIPFHSWWRYCGFELDPLLRKSEKGLVLISDDAIESFIRNILSDNVATRPSLTFIHCSGVLSTPLAESAHPLMTFGPELYDLETYQSLAFVTEMGRKSFSDLFPELPNPSYVIQPGKKQFYHAWTTMAGNFTTILWTEYFKRLESLGLPKEMAVPYLNRIAENALKSSSPLTGPLARGDKATINKHLAALADDELKNIYQAFANTYIGKRT